MGLSITPPSVYLLHLHMFFSFLFMQTLVLVSSTTVTSSTNISCLVSEKKALLQFKKSLIDESDILSSWIGDDCCAWHGVQCDRSTGHVFKLDLHNPIDFFNDDDWLNHDIYSLRGNISKSLQDLKHISYLDLSMNDFSGVQIPEFFGSLLNLRYLNLSFSNFGGRVFHNIGRLLSLQYLDLRYNDFDGSFPTEIGNLTQLRNLDLSMNKFQGPISAQIFTNLTQIRNLDLSVNNFSGSIPAQIFSHLTEIRNLQLSNNEFTGNLPAAVQGLNFLKDLHISDNQLNGNFPTWLSQLTELESLDLSRNLMVGTISEDHMENLTSLKDLHLSSNLDVVVNISFAWTPPFQLRTLRLSSCKVGPRFPQWLQNQREMEHLEISKGSISDTIPDWFENVYSSVMYLDLSQNQIRGKWFENVLNSRVIYIDLSYNQLAGNLLSIPSELEQLDLSNNLLSGLRVADNGNIGNWSLISLFLPNNQLTGEFPTFLCSMTTIEYIHLSNNQLSANLPSCLENLKNLQVLDLTNNTLSGRIPKSLGYLPNLRSLHLHNNKFRGKLPSTFQHLTSLVTLDLAENDIHDILPPWIGESLSSLKFLTLQSNNFQGTIPPQLCHLSNLQLLNLAQNNISGSIPPCFVNLTAMTKNKSDERLIAFYSNATFGYGERILDYLKGTELEFSSSSLVYLISIDLSNNEITGEIPKEVKSLLGLTNLNLSGNHIDGKIPDNLGNLRDLFYLDLSRNEISGPIPQSLSDIPFLTRLNLSFNDLSGRIPTGNQLQSLDDSSIYMGNPKLCGAPISDCSDNNETPDHIDENEQDQAEHNGDDHMWLYSAIGPGFLVGFLTFCGALHFIKTWRYAYFRFLEKVGNRLAVEILIKVAWLHRKFLKH